MFERILVPTDGSKAARKAAKIGCNLASELDATVIFLGVADISLASSNTYIATSEIDDIIEVLKEKSHDDVEQLKEIAEARNVDFETTVDDGIPNETIVEFAKNNNIDLITMGTHGRRGIEWFLIGSVTEKVLQTAPMPVMRIRADESS